MVLAQAGPISSPTPTTIKIVSRLDHLCRVSNSTNGLSMPWMPSLRRKRSTVFGQIRRQVCCLPTIPARSLNGKPFLHPGFLEWIC